MNVAVKLFLQCIALLFIKSAMGQVIVSNYFPLTPEQAGVNDLPTTYGLGTVVVSGELVMGEAPFEARFLD